MQSLGVDPHSPLYRPTVVRLPAYPCRLDSFCSIGTNFPTVAGWCAQHSGTNPVMLHGSLHCCLSLKETPQADSSNWLFKVTWTDFHTLLPGCPPDVHTESNTWLLRCEVSASSGHVDEWDYFTVSCSVLFCVLNPAWRPCFMENQVKKRNHRQSPARQILRRRTWWVLLWSFNKANEPFNLLQVQVTSFPRFFPPFRASARGFRHFTIWSKYTSPFGDNDSLRLSSILLLALSF